MSPIKRVYKIVFEGDEDGSRALYVSAVELTEAVKKASTHAKNSAVIKVEFVCELDVE